MDNEENYLALQEYPIQSSVVELIPARAQRGLSVYDLEFTCLDADEDYIVIGSNVGVVYLVNRLTDYLHKLKDNEHKNAVSFVKVLVSLECLVAVGYKDGTVLVYKVPFQEDQELEKFTVEGLHSVAITALEWAKNGIKFFSGDENGVVVCTEIDHLEHQSRSRILLNENSKIVQLSYSHLNLVVSTLSRSIVYSLKSNIVNQIGQKERKCFGPFGAIIFDEEPNNAVYASRPGQRLWKSDLTGTIQETMIFKTALSESSPSIETLSKTGQDISFTDFQFERLAKYNSYILVWCDTYFVLIDPNKKVLVATSPKMDPIIDVATCKNEIFILRGIRHIVRISNEPDIYSKVKDMKEPSLFEEILEPFKGLNTYVKERSDSVSVQSQNNSTIFDWLKKKRSVSSPADISITENEDIKAPDCLPNIVSLNIDDCIPVKIDELPSAAKDMPELITKDFSKGSDSDDIVYKVKKKHKKNKKVKFSIDAAPKRVRQLSNYNRDSKEMSNVETKSNPVSGKELISKETKSQSNVNEPNTEDFNSDSAGSTENVKMNNEKDTSVIHGLIKNENYDVDTDKLLENVLNAYSHLKHQDLPLDNSTKSVNNSSDIDLQENANINEMENTSSFYNDNNLVQPPIPNQDVNENTITSDTSNLESKNKDIDEVYSPYIKPEIKEAIKPEDSLESLSLESSSISSFDAKFNDPPKYGVDWVEYKAPELLLDISVSSEHIFCVDVRNQMYFSRHPQMGSLNWIELEQPAEKVAASDSETIVWVLYKSTIYSAVQKACCFWENTEWMSVARDVVSIAVDNDCGWYAKSNGELVTQQNLSLAKPCSYPETIPCISPALQVAIKDGVLWVLTISGSLISRRAINGKKSNSIWKEIVLKDIPGIDSIFLGSKKTGWIIDSNGMIHFIIGVTPETPEGTGEPWLVEASSYLVRPITQLEQVVKRAFNSETLTNLIRGKQHLCLSTSDTGIWFCKTYDNLLYSNQKSIIGHMWELVVPPSTASTTKWSCIAADGISNSDGALWCVNSAGELFCYCIKSQSLVPVELPSTSGIRCLQPKYQSLWLLSEDGSIYIRRGISPTCLQGMWWQALDLVQFGSQHIIHISCSSFVSWACTVEGELFMRLGTLDPSPSKMSQAWISIGTANEDATSPLVKVYVGPLGYPVWAIDRKQNVYVREGVTTNLPIGEKWTLIPDLHAKDLCISNNAVWLLKRSGKIYRRFGVTEKNPCGDYWKQMPGNIDYLSVTEDDDLWGLQNGSMFSHYSFVLYSTMNSLTKTLPKRVISEDDWEDIMDEDFGEDS